MIKTFGKEERIFEITGEPVTETRNCKDCENCNKTYLNEKDIIERVRELGKNQ